MLNLVVKVRGKENSDARLGFIYNPKGLLSELGGLIWKAVSLAITNLTRTETWVYKDEQYGWNFRSGYDFDECFKLIEESIVSVMDAKDEDCEKSDRRLETPRRDVSLLRLVVVAALVERLNPRDEFFTLKYSQFENKLEQLDESITKTHMAQTFKRNASCHTEGLKYTLKKREGESRIYQKEVDFGDKDDKEPRLAVNFNAVVTTSATAAQKLPELRQSLAMTLQAFSAPQSNIQKIHKPSLIKPSCASDEWLATFWEIKYPEPLKEMFERWTYTMATNGPEFQRQQQHIKIFIDRIAIAVNSELIQTIDDCKKPITLTVANIMKYDFMANAVMPELERMLNADTSGHSQSKEALNGVIKKVKQLTPEVKKFLAEFKGSWKQKCSYDQIRKASSNERTTTFVDVNSYSVMSTYFAVYQHDMGNHVCEAYTMNTLDSLRWMLYRLNDFQHLLTVNFYDEYSKVSAQISWYESLVLWRVLKITKTLTDKTRERDHSTTSWYAEPTEPKKIDATSVEHQASDTTSQITGAAVTQTTPHNEQRKPVERQDHSIYTHVDSQHYELAKQAASLFPKFDKNEGDFNEVVLKSASIGVISKYNKALSAAKTKGEFCKLAKGMPYLEIYIAYVDLSGYAERVGGMYYTTDFENIEALRKGMHLYRRLWNEICRQYNEAKAHDSISVFAEKMRSESSQTRSAYFLDPDNERPKEHTVFDPFGRATSSPIPKSRGPSVRPPPSPAAPTSSKNFDFGLSAHVSPTPTVSNAFGTQPLSHQPPHSSAFGLQPSVQQSPGGIPGHPMLSSSMFSVGNTQQLFPKPEVDGVVLQTTIQTGASLLSSLREDNPDSSRPEFVLGGKMPSLHKAKESVTPKRDRHVNGQGSTRRRRTQISKQS